MTPIKALIRVQSGSPIAVAQAMGPERKEKAMASRTNDSPPDTVSEDEEGTVETKTGRSRRDVLRGLAAAAAGAIAGGVLSTEKAEADHGTLNAASSTSAPAIHGANTSNGAGVQGSSDSGDGVQGLSGSGDGVEGFSSFGIGVFGFSSIAVGVLAEGPTALRVLGNADFSTAGSGTIPANQDSVFVGAPFVTALSHVTVTLTGDPGQASSQPGFKPVVVWVERQPGTGFVVHMSRPVRVDTPFTYVVVEPA
jgi:hypothetical protein